MPSVNKIESDNRNLVLDLSKGFFILQVILIHTLWGTGKKYIPYDILGQLSLIGTIPLFFYLSGWAMSFQKNTINAYAKRLIQVYLPYVFYAVVLVVIFAVFEQRMVSLHELKEWAIFNYQAITLYQLSFYNLALWYIKLFFTVVVFAPVFLYISKKKALSLFFLIVLVFFNTMFTLSEPSIKHIKVLWLYPLNHFTFYAFFYFLGILTAEFKVNWRECLSIGILNALVFVYLLSIQNFQFDMQKHKFMPSMFYFFYSIFALDIVLLLKNHQTFFKTHYARSRSIRFLEYCGIRVYSIFIYQHIGMALTDYLFKFMPGFNWVVLFPINFLLLVFISVFLAHFTHPVNNYCIRHTVAWVDKSIEKGRSTIKSVLSGN